MILLYCIQQIEQQNTQCTSILIDFCIGHQFGDIKGMKAQKEMHRDECQIRKRLFLFSY